MEYGGGCYMMNCGTLFVVKNVKSCANSGISRIFACKIVIKIEDFSV